MRHGLAVLIQQNLLYHFYEQDTKETLYEANQGAAYGLVRSGKFVEVAEAKFGTTGQDLVRNLLLLGQATVSDLIDFCQADKLQQAGENSGDYSMSGMNGHPQRDPYTEQLESVLSELREIGFVVAVTPRMFCSPTDTRNEIEKAILKEQYGGSTKGTKQKEELEHSVRDHLQALRSEEMQWKSKGKKRALNGDANGMNGNTKRRRTSLGEVKTNGSYNEGYGGFRLEVGFL